MPRSTEATDIDRLPEVLTAGEVRLILRISVDRVYELCKRGILPHQRVGPKLLRFKKQDILEYLRGGGP